LPFKNPSYHPLSANWRSISFANRELEAKSPLPLLQMGK